MSILFTRYDGTPGNLVPGTQLIHEWVNHLCDRGWDMVDVSRGKPSFPAHGPALDAMQASLAAHSDGVITYGTHALGEKSNKARAADFFSKTYGTPFDASHMAFTPGGQLGLYITFKLLHQRQPDGVFVGTQPGYLNYVELIQLVTNSSAEQYLLPITLSQKERFQFRPVQLRAALEGNQKPITGFVFCNPLNPTGQVMSADEWREIADILRQYDAPIILDEAFAEVLFTGEKHQSLLHAAPDLQERTFLLRSGTKAFGMSGERLAVMALPAPCAEEFLYQQSRILANAPMSGQAGMVAAVESLDDATQQDISNYYKENADLLSGALSALLPAQSIIPPQGGFYLLADLSTLFGQPICAEARAAMAIKSEVITNDVELAASLLFGHGALNQQGIAIIPASFFGLAPTAGFARISFSVSREDITKVGEFFAQITCHGEQRSNVAI